MSEVTLQAGSEDFHLDEQSDLELEISIERQGGDKRLPGTIQVVNVDPISAQNLSAIIKSSTGKS